MPPLAKRIFLGGTIILVAMQFSRPVRNQARAPAGPPEITALYATPPAVQAILARACNDCHSDHTRYPWYANVQPAGWWLAAHIRDGKRHLNFSRFGTYAPDQAAHKIEKLVEEIQERKMPLSSYTWLHPNAKLSEAEREAVVTWARSIAAQLPPS